MLLDDEASCAGKFIPVRARHAGICIGCDRFGRDSRNHVAPEAKPDEHGVWGCINRRCSGHALSVEAEAAASNPNGLVVGLHTETTAAGVACAGSS